VKSVSILLALAVGLAFPAAAAAQPVAAMGRPLPDASLRDGMVVIRVVDGDASKPVTGADVTLVIARADGQGEPIEKTARTDPEGRATFTDVEMRMMVKAETPGAEGATISSSPFPMPETGGIRLMLSRQPVAATNAGGPPMNPRAMSGQARPEANDPKDGITVRVSYDDFADAADLSGIKVALVGYRADLAVSAQFGTTDATGRVSFTGLDRRGTTSYFAMALVPRGAGHDRLVSFPMFLTGEAGLRLMLSGEKRTSTAPPGRRSDQARRAAGRGRAGRRGAGPGRRGPRGRHPGRAGRRGHRHGRDQGPGRRAPGRARLGPGLGRAGDA
jgi:hypothetical protein